MENNISCDKCNEYKCIVLQKRIFRIKELEIEIDAEIIKCGNCNKEIFDIDLYEKNLNMAFKIFRKKEGLLFPEEIRSIREQYGLSINSFSKILKWSGNTLDSYEKGALQDNNHNTILLLLRNPINMLEILDNTVTKLNEKEKNILKERVNNLMNNY